MRARNQPRELCLEARFTDNQHPGIVPSASARPHPPPLPLPSVLIPPSRVLHRSPIPAILQSRKRERVGQDGACRRSHPRLTRKGADSLHPQGPKPGAIAHQRVIAPRARKATAAAQRPSSARASTDDLDEIEETEDEPSGTKSRAKPRKGKKVLSKPRIADAESGDDDDVSLIAPPRPKPKPSAKPLAKQPAKRDPPPATTDDDDEEGDEVDGAEASVAQATFRGREFAVSKRIADALIAVVLLNVKSRYASHYGISRKTQRAHVDALRGKMEEEGDLRDHHPLAIFMNPSQWQLIWGPKSLAVNSTTKIFDELGCWLHLGGGHHRLDVARLQLSATEEEIAVLRKRLQAEGLSEHEKAKINANIVALEELAERQLYWRAYVYSSSTCDGSLHHPSLLTQLNTAELPPEGDPNHTPGVATAITRLTENTRRLASDGTLHEKLQTARDEFYGAADNLTIDQRIKLASAKLPSGIADNLIAVCPRRAAFAASIYEDLDWFLPKTGRGWIEMTKPTPSLSVRRWLHNPLRYLLPAVVDLRASRAIHCQLSGTRPQL